MSINELQDEVVAEFSDFDDWMDRYQLLIDLGNEQEPLDEKYKTEQNLIEGCQSRVWLQADEVDGKIIFKAESDALIVTTQIVSARKIPVKISGAFFSVINDVKYPSSATSLPDVVKYSKKYFVIHPPMTE